MFDIVDNDSERIYLLRYNKTMDMFNLFEENADEFIKSDHRDMIIDMNEQTVINSFLLASLIRIKNRLSINKREMLLKNCNPHIYRCIEMAGLDSFFSFSDFS